MAQREEGRKKQQLKRNFSQLKMFDFLILIFYTRVEGVEWVGYIQDLEIQYYLQQDLQNSITSVWR